MSKGHKFKSRLTPGLTNAVDVSLSIDDRITYSLLDGGTVGGVIAGPYSQHDNGAYGWECRFDDDGQIGFADELRVTNWPGKVP